MYLEMPVTLNMMCGHDRGRIMKMKEMRKMLACILALVLMLSCVCVASADTYPSIPFRLPAVKARPTEVPAPVETEAPAP